MTALSLVMALATLPGPHRLAMGQVAGAGDTQAIAKAREVTSEAQALQKKGELAAALKKANEAIAILPSAFEPHIVRGGICMAMKQYKDALDDWLFVKGKMEPGNGLLYMVHFYMAECRLNLGDRAGARADALEAKRLAPASANPEKIKELAMLLQVSALPLDALWLSRLTEEGQDVYSIWELHSDGTCVVHSQPFRKVGDYTIDVPAKGAWPKDVRTHIGKATFEAGRWRMSLTKPQAKTVEGTFELSPDYQTMTVVVDGTKGRVECKRIAIFEVSSKASITQQQNDLASEAMALKEKGDLPAALKKADQAVDLLVTAIAPRIARASILMSLERYKDALADWSDAKLFMEPGDPHAFRPRLYSGHCKLKLGDAAGARAEALEAKQMAPKSIKPEDMKAIDELIGAAGRAIKDDPLVVKDGTVTGTIEAFHKKQGELMDEAQALQKKGNLPAALKKATEAVDLLPLTLDPHIVRANILMALKRYKDALVDWSYLVENSEPDDEDAYFFYFKRSDCRRLIGDRAGARADAIQTKKLAPKTLNAETMKEVDRLLIMANPLPVGAYWTRIKTDGNRKVFSVWELLADGRCAVHLLPYRKDGKYQLGPPQARAWPGYLSTWIGEATFKDGRWRMTFSDPAGKIAQGTYRLSADNKTLFGTEDGIEGGFTRQWNGFGDEGVVPEP